MIRAMLRTSISALVVTLTLTGLAGASGPTLPTLTEPVDLHQYAGDWFVHGAIPMDIPFFSDAEARNYTEHYELLGSDKIRMTSSFETPDAKRKSFSFNGRVVDQPVNATWSISLLWPLRAEYSIIYLDEAYETTVVASPNRRNAWIMSRYPHMSEQQYAGMLAFMTSAGFDPQAFRKVPHDSAEPVQVASLQAPDTSLR